jgi:hypothetical protein
MRFPDPTARLAYNLPAPQLSVICVVKSLVGDVVIGREAIEADLGAVGVPAWPIRHDLLKFNNARSIIGNTSSFVKSICSVL